MAKNDSGRDGIHNDFDGRPGNSAESASYSRIYDPSGQTETSNLPEPQNFREAERLIASIRSYERDRGERIRDARSDVHFFPSVGKFIIPKQNTWAAHAELIKDPSYAMEFNPERYVYFDKIVAEEFGNKALTDPNHRDYHKLDGLRTNLAVLRNDIIGMYLDDESFDPGDEKWVPHFITIASALGQSLANDTWLKRPFTQHMSVDVANVEAVGAREMYQHLLELKSTPVSIRSMLSSINVPDIENRAWRLIPLEETPFSDQNLAEPLPEARLCLTTDELAKYCAANHMCAEDKISLFGEAALTNTVSINALDRLEEPARLESLEEARKILRWLKNLSFGDMDVEEWLAQGTPAEQASKAEAVSRLVEIYELQLATTQTHIAGIENELAVDDATGASGMMAIALAEHGLRGLPSSHSRVEKFATLAQRIDEHWRDFEGQSAHRLLDIVEDGLEHMDARIAGRQNAADRLLEISTQIQHTAHRLRSVDTLEPPAREESIELAREILRWFKNLKFSDKPVEEMLSNTNPEERVFVTRKMAEMVDMYNNLLQEAANNNPEILQDPRIKEANDAVGGFAHAIKLMASKEIPSSIAAAQQISADVTQMPEEWKQLHDRAVNRLVASMEGGLQKAVDELGTAQQEAQDKDEELAQQIVESSLISGHNRKKRRRKRRSAQTTGGLTKAAKRRNANDLNGDGVADRLQGLNLRGEDMIAIRQLGGSLRDMNAEAISLKPVITEVSLTAPLAPDDRNFVTREKEDQQRGTRGNNQRPRN